MIPNTPSPPNQAPTNPLMPTLACHPSSTQETMYHGTSMQGAESILRHGFTTSEGGLLGSGVYLTTDKSKAALYGPRVLTCSVDVGSKCCIDKRKHRNRLNWPLSCDTKFIPAHAAHQWTSQKGDVHCVWDKTRIAIVDVQDVRCCPCSIADCRQCFPSHKQQKAQRLHLIKTGKVTDQSCILCPAPSLMEKLMAEITGACQIPVRAEGCSNGLAQQDLEGQLDGSSTANGSETSDDESSTSQEDGRAN